MHDLYTLIDKIKKAPSMYLGRHSIICLQAFLSGYSVAKHELREQPTQQDRDFMQFPEWIRKKFNVQTSQSWANVILFYSEDESKALDRFFELLEATATNVYLIFFPKPDIAKALSGKLELQEVSGV